MRRDRWSLSLLEAGRLVANPGGLIGVSQHMPYDGSQRIGGAADETVAGASATGGIAG